MSVTILRAPVVQAALAKVEWWCCNANLPQPSHPGSFELHGRLQHEGRVYEHSRLYPGEFVEKHSPSALQDLMTFDQKEISRLFALEVAGAALEK